MRPPWVVFSFVVVEEKQGGKSEEKMVKNI